VKRHALILSNPGELNADNYCEGVRRDVENYTKFFLNPIGGLWADSEVVQMERPSVQQVRQEIQRFRTHDYVMTIFTGHGWYSTKLESTILELRKGQEIDSAELRTGSAKLTLILDCCREKYAAAPEMVVLAEKMAKVMPSINPDDCRKYYDKRIAECPSELVVMYACGTGQRAGDDSQRGGAYSHSLMRSAYDWAENCDVDTSRSYSILGVSETHDLAIPRVRRLRGDRQMPQIEKPRSGPYYPFCIVA